MKRYLIFVLLIGVFFANSINSLAFLGKNKKRGDVLKVVAAYGNKEEIFKAFTEDTGIKVEFLDMSSGEVLARTEAEGGRPMADLWFGGGIDAFIKAKDRGLLEKFVSAEDSHISEKYKDKDGYWYGISLVTAGFMVNNEILSEKNLQAPLTWKDLTSEQYKDEILLADPSISGTNYAIYSSLLQSMGREEGIKYYQKLVDNCPYIAKRGGEPPKKTALGEVAVGIIPISGEFLVMRDKFPVDVIYPADGIPWVPAGMAIFKNADNLRNAEKFVDWALSEGGQRTIRDQDPRIMTRSGIEPHELMNELPLSKLLDVDFLKSGSQRDELIKVWKNEIVR